MYVSPAGGSATHKVNTRKITSSASPPAKITQKRICKEASPSPISTHHHPEFHTQLAQWSSPSSLSSLDPRQQAKVIINMRSIQHHNHHQQPQPQQSQTTAAIKIHYLSSITIKPSTT
jgi:hypothetical protein